MLSIVQKSSIIYLYFACRQSDSPVGSEVLLSTLEFSGLLKKFSSDVFSLICSPVLVPDHFHRNMNSDLCDLSR